MTSGFSSIFKRSGKFQDCQKCQVFYASGWNFGGISFQDEDQKAFLQAVGLGYVELLRRFDIARKKAKEELEGK